MKTPRGIVVAVGGYAILIVFRILMYVMAWSAITIRLTIIFLIIHAIQMIGIIGLLLKKKWSRKYTMALFTVILLFHLGSLDGHFKQPDMLNLGLTIAVLGMSFYVFHQFYTEPDIQKYLNS
jgi:hypothetical protein